MVQVDLSTDHFIIVSKSPYCIFFILSIAYIFGSSKLLYVTLKHISLLSRDAEGMKSCHCAFVIAIKQI